MFFINIFRRLVEKPSVWRLRIFSDQVFLMAGSARRQKDEWSTFVKTTCTCNSQLLFPFNGWHHS